jgi:hypothetical protein
MLGLILSAAVSVGPAALRTGVVGQPGSVELAAPSGKSLRFSWRNDGGDLKGLVQTTYEVEVNGAAGFHWASAVVASAEQQVRPADLGMPELAADADYRWRVRTALAGSSTAAAPAPATREPFLGPTWSASLAFSTAPSNATFADAGAVWIGGKNQLRADLVLPSGSATPVRARAFVSGLGAFYLHINGERVGS